MMKPQISYPHVTAVKPLPEKRLLVTFSTGETKVYDCKPLLEEEVFRPLKDQALFQCAHADRHGYGVIWNDEIDLSESELWLNGKPTESPAGVDPSDNSA